MLTTQDQREAAFQAYLEATEPYFAAVEAKGDKPWFDSEDERRELFMRRYTRPEPPAALPLKSLAQIRNVDAQLAS